MQDRTPFFNTEIIKLLIKLLTSMQWAGENYRLFLKLKSIFSLKSLYSQYF
uniref:Uncharacterized protein n=1 Tax=Octopus bimaculoides TaxID=37653 RepID=A0A0L8I846_OCTBM